MNRWTLYFIVVLHSFLLSLFFFHFRLPIFRYFRFRCLLFGLLAPQPDSLFKFKPVNFLFLFFLRVPNSTQMKFLAVALSALSISQADRADDLISQVNLGDLKLLSTSREFFHGNLFLGQNVSDQCLVWNVLSIKLAF